MSSLNNKPNDIVENAVEALRSMPTPEGPPPELFMATVEALQAQSTPRAALPIARRRQPMLRIMRYCGVAAGIVLAVLAGSLWLMDRNASFSFAQVVDKVSKAKTVSFVLRQKLGDQPEFESKMSIHEHTLRYEIPGVMTMILDTNGRKGLQLDPGRKIATKIDLVGRVPAEDLQDPIDQLRNLKDKIKDNVQQLADEELDGRKCHVYEVRGQIKAGAVLIGDRFKLWVDAKTGLPAKIHGSGEKTSLTYEQFRWNEPLADELFSLNVPRDYRMEEFTPAIVRPGRIYYHKGWTELYSIQPDGQRPEMQFVPRLENSPNVYVSNRAELSPDGRYLAMAYTHATNEGGFPPYRILLWDRTQPKEAAVEIYARPDGELQFWQFSPDGQRLYVGWWQGMPDRKGPEGRYGADVVDLKANTKRTLTMPKYKNRDGKEEDMRFATASSDGQSYLVVGQGLHVATPEGKLLRRLSALETRVIATSVRLSPDGKLAVYTTFNTKDHSEQLLVAPVAGGQTKELVPLGKVIDVRARWSPEGKRIAYTSRLLDPSHPPTNYGNETYLKLVDADGANLVTLRTEKVHPNGPSLELTAWR